MTGPKVFMHVTQAEVASGLQPVLDELTPLGARLEFLADESEQAFIKGARDADAIIGAWRGAGRPITASMIATLERCKVIALCIVGSDRVDVAAATARGIPVTNVPDIFIAEVADHALALILSLQRRIPTLEQMVRSGRWAEARPFLSGFPRLQGQVLGLIGFGRAGREVARRAAPFGMRLIAYDPFIDETAMAERGVEPVSMPELLRTSDIISVHAAGGPGTEKLISARELALMKPTAVLINTARGAIIDEEALVAALREGRLGGAALDVLVEEPIRRDHPLLGFPNVILTPHVGSASNRMEPARRQRAAREVALVLKGQWPRSCVNPDVLQKAGLERWQPLAMDRGPAR